MKLIDKNLKNVSGQFYSIVSIGYINNIRKIVSTNVWNQIKHQVKLQIQRQIGVEILYKIW